MSDNTLNRPRRAVANYASSPRDTVSGKNKFKFNPIEKKKQFLNKQNTGNKLQNSNNENTAEASGSHSPQVTVLLREEQSTQSKKQNAEEMTDIEETSVWEEKEHVTEDNEENNTNEWLEVKKKKGKGKQKEKNDNIFVSNKKQNKKNDVDKIKRYTAYSNQE